MSPSPGCPMGYPPRLLPTFPMGSSAAFPLTVRGQRPPQPLSVPPRAAHLSCGLCTTALSLSPCCGGWPRSWPRAPQQTGGAGRAAGLGGHCPMSPQNTTMGRGSPRCRVLGRRGRKARPAAADPLGSGSWGLWGGHILPGPAGRAEGGGTGRLRFGTRRGSALSIQHPQPRAPSPSTPLCSPWSSTSRAPGGGSGSPPAQPRAPVPQMPSTCCPQSP